MVPGRGASNDESLNETSRWHEAGGIWQDHGGDGMSQLANESLGVKLDAYKKLNVNT